MKVQMPKEIENMCAAAHITKNAHLVFEQRPEKNEC